MCYSAPASFSAWGIAMISLIYLLQKGVPFRDLVFATTFSQMQLFEGLRWLNAGNETFLALAAKASLYLQPIALLYEFKYPVWLYIVYVIIQSLLEYNIGSDDYRFTVAKNGHFVWNFLSGSPYSFIPYFAIFGLVLFSKFKPIAIVWNLLFFGYCLYTYFDSKTWGTIWCYWSNGLWIYYLLQYEGFIPSMKSV